MTSAEGFITEIAGDPESILAAADWLHAATEALEDVRIETNKQLSAVVDEVGEMHGDANVSQFQGRAAQRFTEVVRKLMDFADQEKTRFDGTETAMRTYAFTLVSGKMMMETLRGAAALAGLKVTPTTVEMGAAPPGPLTVEAQNAQLETMRETLTELSDAALKVRESIIEAADAITPKAAAAWSDDSGLGEDIVKAFAQFQYDAGKSLIGSGPGSVDTPHTPTDLSALKWVDRAGKALDGLDVALSLIDGEPVTRVVVSKGGEMVVTYLAGAGVSALGGGPILVIGVGIGAGMVASHVIEGIYDSIWGPDEEEDLKLSRKQRALVQQFDCSRYYVGGRPHSSSLFSSR